MIKRMIGGTEEKDTIFFQNGKINAERRRMFIRL